METKDYKVVRVDKTNEDVQLNVEKRRKINKILGKLKTI